MEIIHTSNRAWAIRFMRRRLITKNSGHTTAIFYLCHTMHDSESHSGSGFGSKSE